MNLLKSLPVVALAVSFLSIPQYATAENASVYQVGDKAEGGVVFYVNRLGTHGLVAALTDQRQNIDRESPDTARTGDVCSLSELFDSEGQLFADWRLPTKPELKLLYDARDYVGNFAAKKSIFYVSGMMNMGTHMWGKSFGTGATDRFPFYPLILKSSATDMRALNIRCIRSF